MSSFVCRVCVSPSDGKSPGVASFSAGVTSSGVSNVSRFSDVVLTVDTDDRGWGVCDNGEE